MEISRHTLPNEILLGEVTKLLDEGRDVVIMTKGFSMNPFIIGDRDSVELRKMTPSAGMIALAQISKGHYVLHRIESIDGDRVVLHGDGNLQGRERCRLEDISGCVTKILKPGGRETNCLGRCFAIKSKCWLSQPYIIRRYFLAIFRRVFI